MSDVLTFDKLVDAVIQRESSGKIDNISDAGATGLMGIMPKDAIAGFRRNVPKVFDLARSMGYDVLPEDETYETALFLPEDPQINTTIGRALLDELMALYKGDATHTLTAYNAGVGKYEDFGRDPSKLDKQEQREYAAKVSEDYESMFGSPLPKNLGVLVSPIPKRRPNGLLDQ